MTRDDMRALADGLRAFSGRTAIEPEEAVVMIADVCAERAGEDFDPAAFYAACGFMELGPASD